MTWCWSNYLSFETFLEVISEVYNYATVCKQLTLNILAIISQSFKISISLNIIF